MQLRSASSLFLICLASMLTVSSVAPLLSAPADAGFPLALAALLIAVVLLVVATASVRRLAGRAVLAWRHAARSKRAPDRQCDPDAAGHVRPRAPGLPFTLLTH